MNPEEIARLMDAEPKPKHNIAGIYNEWDAVPGGHTLDIGVEIEIYIGRRRGRFFAPFGENTDDGYILHTILSRCKDKVFRDYYPHQLEIRAGPGKAPQVIEELQTTLKEIGELLRPFKCGLLFRSRFGDFQTCGLHIHADVSLFNDRLDTLGTAMAVSYLPILMNYEAHRDTETKHSRIVDNKFSQAVYDVADTLDKYHDLHLSPARENPEGRHRLVKPITWETRIYDTAPPESMWHGILKHSEILSRSLQLVESNSDCLKIPARQIFAAAVRYRGKFFNQAPAIYNYHKKMWAWVGAEPVPSEQAIWTRWIHSLDIFSNAIVREINGIDELITHVLPYNRWRKPMAGDWVLNVLTHELGRFDEMGEVRLQNGDMRPFDVKFWYKVFTFEPGQYYIARVMKSGVVEWTPQNVKTPAKADFEGLAPSTELKIISQEVQDTVQLGFIDQVSKPAFGIVRAAYSANPNRCPL